MSAPEGALFRGFLGFGIFVVTGVVVGVLLGQDAAEIGVFTASGTVVGILFLAGYLLTRRRDT